MKHADSRGRIHYLNTWFELADNRTINVEIDGTAHPKVLDAWSGTERDLWEEIDQEEDEIFLLRGTISGDAVED